MHFSLSFLAIMAHIFDLCLQASFLSFVGRAYEGFQEVFVPLKRVSGFWILREGQAVKMFTSLSTVCFHSSGLIFPF